jgi:predicted alpha/beta-hydrolase family hydrolase
VLEVDTPRGVANVMVERPKRRPIALLVLGHGAGGGVDAADLQAVRRAALGAGIAVALVTQPYRVLGRSAPPAAAALDEAWSVAVAAARKEAGPRLPLVVGGRSLGARVACRTAASLGAVGVLALAFPLHPPGRPDKTRAGELDVEMPTLVVNGDADPFGVPHAIGRVRVEVRPGERHELRRDPDGVAEVAVAWLRDLLGTGSLKPANPA